MTNLEYYADELKKYIYDYSEGGGGYYKFDDVSGGVHTFIQRHPEIWEGDINAEEAIDWFLAEHKEKIKLTEFEHDVLKAFTKYSTYVEDDRIDNYIALQDLSSAGWFQNVDENLSIKEILDNCEIVD